MLRETSAKVIMRRRLLILVNAITCGPFWKPRGTDRKMARAKRFALLARRPNTSRQHRRGKTVRPAGVEDGPQAAAPTSRIFRIRLWHALAPGRHAST